MGKIRNVEIDFLRSILNASILIILVLLFSFWYISILEEEMEDIDFYCRISRDVNCPPRDGWTCDEAGAEPPPTVRSTNERER